MTANVKERTQSTNSSFKTNFPSSSFCVETCLSTREMDGEQVRETEFDVGDYSEQQANMEANDGETLDRRSS